MHSDDNDVKLEKPDKKEEYRIAISRDGKFAATFDTGKILFK